MIDRRKLLSAAAVTMGGASLGIGTGALRSRLGNQPDAPDVATAVAPRLSGLVGGA